MATTQRNAESGAVYVSALVTIAVALAVAGGVHVLGGQTDGTYRCQAQAVASIGGQGSPAADCGKGTAAKGARAPGRLPSPAEAAAGSQAAPGGFWTALWQEFGIGAAAAEHPVSESHVATLNFDLYMERGAWGLRPEWSEPKSLDGSCAHPHGCRLRVTAPGLGTLMNVKGTLQRSDQAVEEFRLNVNQDDAFLEVPPGDFEMNLEAYGGMTEAGYDTVSVLSWISPLEPGEAPAAEPIGQGGGEERADDSCWIPGACALDPFLDSLSRLF